MGLTSPFDDWCEDTLAFELGVVEMPEWGDPGLTASFPPKFDLDEALPSAFMLVCVPGLSKLLLLDAFCCARRSCLRNLARLFWNQT